MAVVAVVAPAKREQVTDAEPVMVNTPQATEPDVVFLRVLEPLRLWPFYAGA